MNITTLALGPLNTNCYITSCPQTLETIIIDPADEGSLISEKILEQKLKPKYIILTHGHFDHVLGLLEVKLNFDIPILIHTDDQFLLKKTQSNAHHWLKMKVDPVPPADSYLKDDQTIKFGTQTLKIIHSPGHTPGSICLYSAQNKLCFTGDTLFKNAIGRTDLSYSDPKLMQQSLKKLFKLPATTTIYPGHGTTSTISEEKQ